VGQILKIIPDFLLLYSTALIPQLLEIGNPENVGCLLFKIIIQLYYLPVRVKERHSGELPEV